LACQIEQEVISVMMIDKVNDGKRRRRSRVLIRKLEVQDGREHTQFW
jgi:hypothetical protein